MPSDDLEIFQEKRTQGGNNMNSGLVPDWVVLLTTLAGLIIIITTFHQWRQQNFTGKMNATSKKLNRANGTTVSLKDPQAHDRFKNTLRQQLEAEAFIPGRALIILCIGSDRCTGDCLGPLVGSFLEEENQGSFKIYGTLQRPVHALNLENCLQKIWSTYYDPFIIAIDAALSCSPKDTQTVVVKKEPLKPGDAVNKKLPPVGHLSITGIVSDLSGFHSARLYSVTDMARFIASGLRCVLNHEKKQAAVNIKKTS